MKNKKEGFEVKYAALDIIYKKADEVLDETKLNIELQAYSIKLLYDLAEKIKALEV